MRKNVAGQRVAVFMLNNTGNGQTPIDANAQGTAGNLWQGKTGYASDLNTSIDTYVIKDGGTPTLVTNDWTELSATHMPGVYLLELTQAETNADRVEVFLNSKDHAATSVNKPHPKLLTFETDPDWDTELFGPGFTTLTDNLTALRTSMNTGVFPTLRSGQSTTELSGTGWLSNLVDKIRRWVDLPSTNARYSQARMLEQIQQSVRELFADPNITGARRMLVRYTVQLVADQQEYTLPPQVGQVVSVAFLDTNGNPTSVQMPYGHPGVSFQQCYWIEGNILKLRYPYSWSSSDRLQVIYKPSGSIMPVMATASAVAGDGTTVTFPATMTDGTLDVRENAYAGYVLRVVSATTNGYKQVAGVASWNNTTRIATLVRPLSPVPSGTVVVELVPVFYELFVDVLALHVARSLAASDVKADRFKVLTQRYIEAARALRLAMTKPQTYSASRLDGRSAENEDWAQGGYWWWVE